MPHPLKSFLEPSQAWVILGSVLYELFLCCHHQLEVEVTREVLQDRKSVLKDVVNCSESEITHLLNTYIFQALDKGLYLHYLI